MSFKTVEQWEISGIIPAKHQARVLLAAMELDPSVLPEHIIFVVGSPEWSRFQELMRGRREQCAARAELSDAA